MKTPQERADFIAEVVPRMPYSIALGLSVERAIPGELDITMPYAEALVGDPETGVIHGGAVFALMDTTCGGAVMAHPEASLQTATIDLRIDYMRSAKPGQAITAKATCYHVTRSVAFVRGVAYDEDPDNPVAMATAAFTVEPAI